MRGLLEKDAVGRVVIDLPAIIAGNIDADIQLEAGRFIVCAEFSNTISVIGEVRQPGNFRFESDRRWPIIWILPQAHGPRRKRDLCRSCQWSRSTSYDEAFVAFVYTAGVNELQPGDTIVVPVNEEYQPTLARYREVSTVVFQSIASLYPLFRL